MKLKNPRMKLTQILILLLKKTSNEVNLNILIKLILTDYSSLNN